MKKILENDKKRPSPKQKEKRKLEYERKEKLKLPLQGKSLYIDIKDARLLKKLESDLKTLGASVEKFFIKEINYLITNQPLPPKKSKPESANSPGDSTPSPFNILTPSPNTIEGRPPPKNVSRGKAILEKVNLERKKNPILENAEKWGVKIVPIEVAKKWIEKELSKLPLKRVKNGNAGDLKKWQSWKVKRLASPLLKVESCTRHYRPFYKQLESWPHINVDTPKGTCPFDGAALGKGVHSREERGDRIGLNEADLDSPATPLGGVPTKSAASKEDAVKTQKKPLIGMPIVTAGELKRRKEQKKQQEKKKGYCECCDVKYENIDKHVREEGHKEFVRDKNNYRTLDDLIKSGPNTANFLKCFLLQQCYVKKTQESDLESQNASGPVLVGTKKSVKNNDESSKNLCDTSSKKYSYQRKERNCPQPSEEVPKSNDSENINQKQKCPPTPISTRRSVSKDKSNTTLNCSSKNNSQGRPSVVSPLSDELYVKNHVVPRLKKNSLGVYTNLSPSKASWARKSLDTEEKLENDKKGASKEKIKLRSSAKRSLDRDLCKEELSHKNTSIESEIMSEAKNLPRKNSFLIDVMNDEGHVDILTQENVDNNSVEDATKLQQISETIKPSDSHLVLEGQSESFIDNDKMNTKVQSLEDAIEEKESGMDTEQESVPLAYTPEISEETDSKEIKNRKRVKVRDKSSSPRYFVTSMELVKQRTLQRLARKQAMADDKNDDTGSSNIDSSVASVPGRKKWRKKNVQGTPNISCNKTFCETLKSSRKKITVTLNSTTSPANSGSILEDVQDAASTLKQTSNTPCSVNISNDRKKSKLDGKCKEGKGNTSQKCDLSTAGCQAEVRLTPKKNSGKDNNVDAYDFESCFTPEKPNSQTFETPKSGYSSNCSRRKKSWRKSYEDKKTTCKKRLNRLTASTPKALTKDSENVKPRSRIKMKTVDVKKTVDSDNNLSGKRLSSFSIKTSEESNSIEGNKSIADETCVKLHQKDLSYLGDNKSRSASVSTSRTEKGNNISLKWCSIGKSPKKKVVKLNNSWSLLSDRSVVKLLDSEDEEESFEGFDPDQSTDQLGSDLSYEHTMELKFEAEPDKEWEIDKEELYEEKSDVIEYTQCTFTSPGKKSDSSWEDPLNHFIEKQVRKSGTKITHQSSPHGALQSPRSARKRRRSGSHGNTPRKSLQKSTCKNENFNSVLETVEENLMTPSKKRKVGNHQQCDNTMEQGIERVDDEIQFNHFSPQKLQALASPLREQQNIVGSPNSLHDSEYYEDKLQCVPPQSKNLKKQQSKVILNEGSLLIDKDNGHTSSHRTLRRSSHRKSLKI